MFAACLLAATAIVGPATAQRSDAELFAFEPGAVADTDVRVAERYSVAMTLPMRALGAVRLQDAITPTSVSWSGAKPKRALRAGEILVPAGPDRGVYCAPIPQGIWTTPTFCLRDTDGDGRFDANLSANFTSGRAQGILVTDKGKLYGVDFSKPSPLPSPIPYARAALTESPVIQVQLHWATTFSPKRPTNGPVTISFWFDGGADGAAGQVRSDEQTIIRGEGSQIQLGGLRLQVLGLDGKGRVRYQIEGIDPDRPLHFNQTPMANQMTIYL